ncbi:MAG TPA: tetratricopeptide repeat protein [Pirellulaceae bacterium]|nr:tetratricopeptide repeat protein [Pirellulaceae bacterium]
MTRTLSGLSGILALLLAVPSWSAEEMPPATVAELARQARPSVVVISVAGRDGTQQGLGTGFVIAPEGLIATNLHVIGEARPITVQTADGKSLRVSGIRAWDRTLDLAVVEVEAKDLPALKLGDSDKPQQGDSIVVMGNPFGLKHSVVSGVLSEQRDIDGRKMLQIAFPVEPGNSGGPVLDAQGKVLGIVTMKSRVTENLGFAVPINALKPLLEKPNPVAIEKWLTIGAIDRSVWLPLFGASWQQRGGRIMVSGSGQGFGGRSLCLLDRQPPELPYEVGVAVKLDDEAGAAGLVFHADGQDVHYGFYPSAGKLRLSRFEGPDVFSWKVLEEKPSDHYRPGEWNFLKVRVEKDKLQCFVNDELAIESTDRALGSGKVGLAKFRQTQAQFKQFQLAASIPPRSLPDEKAQQIAAAVEKLPSIEHLTDQSLAPLAEASSAGVDALRKRSQELRRRAEELERMAAEVQARAAVAELARLAGPEAEKVDLLRAALTIARLDEEEVDIEAYVQQVERIAKDIRAKLPEKADDAARLSALSQHLFTESGFHGSRFDYYNRANSYLNRVIDDREGLPITLSVLYLELAARLDLKMEGVGLPGHFVVRQIRVDGEPQLIDVFEGGRLMSREDAEKRIRESTGEPAAEEHFRPVTERQILVRMLQNLLGVAQGKQDKEAMLRYLEAMIAIDPELARERGLRAIVQFETGRRDAAVTGLEWFFEKKPAGVDLDQVREMREYFRTGKPGE